MSVCDGVRALLPDAEVTAIAGCSAQWNELSTEGFAEAVEAAKNADAVVLCLGEPQKYSGEGNSRADLGLPGVQLRLAREILAVNPNTAALIFNGRPLVLTELDAIAPAIMTMWFPGTEGGNAAARLLWGDANPCGKVTMSFPKAVGQCPIYYNHPATGRPKRKPEDVHQPYASNYIGCGNLPLYPFGHGLSYTSFVYEALELDRHELTSDGAITVRVTLKNTGERRGKEVVQLYVHEEDPAVYRPIRELKAFEKVLVKAHEKKQVVLSLDRSAFAYYSTQKKQWAVNEGTFAIQIGKNANEILLEKQITFA